MKKFSKILIIFIFAICLCGTISKVKADPAYPAIGEVLDKIQEMGVEALNLTNLQEAALSLEKYPNRADYNNEADYLKAYAGITDRKANLWLSVQNMQFGSAGSDRVNSPNFSQNLYCIGHLQTLSSIPVQYKIKKYVNIYGNTARVAVSTNQYVTPNLSAPIGNEKNGTLAYILAAGRDKLVPAGNQGTQGSSLPLDGHSYWWEITGIVHGTEHYGFRQQLIYSYINNWLAEVGNYAFGYDMSCKENLSYPNRDNNVDKIIAEAEDYARKLNESSTNASIKQTYSNYKNRITVKVEKDEQLGDEDFLVVGPFNFTFTGKVTSKILYDDNNQVIQISKIFKYDGQKEVNTDIESGKDFYIKISTKFGYNSIKTIQLNVETTNTSKIYTAEIWFIEAAEYQNLILVKGGEENQPITSSGNESFDYNIPLTKTITITKRDQDNGRTLEGVKFRIINSKGQYLAKNANGTIEYKASADNTSTIFTTDSHGRIVLNNVRVDTYKVYEIENPIFGYEDNAGLTQDIGLSETTVNIYNKLYTKTLIIRKVDQDNQNIPLPAVSFIFKCRENNKYVKRTNGVISYVDSRDQATEFTTSTEGYIVVNDLIKGTYEAVETKNPNYGYEITNDSIIIDRNTTGTTTITNRLKYIKLSGYIWEDIHSEKQTVRNDLYKNDINDDNDKAFNGITVRLKDKNGNIVKLKDKNGNYIDAISRSAEYGIYQEINGGEYYFDNVEIDNLANYYVEFEYDGLIWESVTPENNVNNGSKAIDTLERNALNKNFASVNSTGENAVNVNNRYRITYDNTKDHETSIKDSSDCILHADTRQTKYELKYDRKTRTKDTPQIKYINLGLYKRPQADMALVQNLYNVNLGINGYWHTYNYDSRLNQKGNVVDNSQLWNVGVKFTNEYTGKYKRAIYESDLEYTNSDKTKELQVYLTYKIALRNESSYITRVNSIINYFDNRYGIVAAGTGLSSENVITDAITGIQSSSYRNGYNKAIINVNTTVNPGEVKYIYLQFALNSDAVRKIASNGETLCNISEINSYTVYKGGNTVAAVDIDSVPGNARVGETNTYEDDIDSAPSIQLEITNPRKITGTVFEDHTDDKLHTGQTREGNGIFESGENRIEGVKVTLHEVNNTIPDMTYTTKQDGNFEFSGFIPGQYIITYTWGDKTYKVQNYKGTIYDSSRNQNNMYWYRQDVGTRKTDAIDDYNARLNIDSQTRQITDNTIYAKVEEAYNGNNPYGIITSMNSTTPKMEFPVEIDPSDFNGIGNRAEFIVENVDFGIAERARQVLDLDKSIKAFKVILSNGQILIDATIDEHGNLQGATNHLTYMGPNANNGNNYSGFIKAELDDELIEGSTLEVQYEIKAINNSEVDYTSENYYKYGKKEGKKVTLRPSSVVDYLDKNLAFEASKNGDWEQITVDKLKELNAKKVDNTDFLNSKTILYTEALQKDLEPTQTTSVHLNVSKLLTTSKDITFYNTAEVTEIEKTQTKVSTGGIVNKFNTDDAEEAIIMPSTGKDKSYVLPIIIGTTSLLILCVGVIVIKKQVIDK